MKLCALLIGLLIFGIHSAAASPLTKTTDNNWLTGADDKTRAARLELYLGGFSTAMQDTGLRFAHVKQAIADENWELARYHWSKIATAIENGLMKRPARRANAEAIFLKRAWEPLDQALAEKKGEAVQAAFQKAREACMACHAAEKVPFMNDQPLFRNP